jgi:hypothetical protein
MRKTYHASQNTYFKTIFPSLQLQIHAALTSIFLPHIHFLLPVIPERIEEGLKEALHTTLEGPFVHVLCVCVRA